MFHVEQASQPVRGTGEKRSHRSLSGRQASMDVRHFAKQSLAKTETSKQRVQQILNAGAAGNLVNRVARDP